MRTVRIYKNHKSHWISPGELWSAIKSGEDFKFVNHSGSAPDVLQVIDEAEVVLRRAFKNSILRGLKALLSGAALALILQWPPISSRMITEVKYGIQGLWIICALLGLMSIVANALNLRLLRKEDWFPRVTQGPRLYPPPSAYREIEPKTAKVTFSVLLFCAVIFLNSIVIATPLAPAVIWDTSRVVRSVELVAPFTSWEQRPRYPSGEGLAAFAMASASDVWAVRIVYTINHTDILTGPYDYDSWITGRVNLFVNNMMEYIMQDIPTNITDQYEQAEYIAHSLRNPEVIVMLEQALMSHFGQRYTGMKLQTVKITVEKVTLSEYQKFVKKQRQ